VKHLLATLCAFVALSPAITTAAPPSEASVHELLAVIEAQKLLDGLWAQLEGMNRATAQKMLEGQQLTDAQRQIVDEMQTRMMGLLRDELRWEAFEPMMLDVYARTFTQDEVDGMLVFYRSDAGKAVIAKMPLAMQNTMQAVQARMAPLQEKLQRIVRESVDKMKATQAAPAAP